MRDSYLSDNGDLQNCCRCVLAFAFDLCFEPFLCSSRKSRNFGSCMKWSASASSNGFFRGDKATQVWLETRKGQAECSCEV